MLANKIIYIMRHAKSDWHADYQLDHQRPLSDRGVKSTKLVAHYLSSSNNIPQKIVSSTAVRAMDTAKLAANHGEWELEPEFNDSLYLSSVEQILQLIMTIDDKFQKVMLVSHEPTCSYLCHQLAIISNTELLFYKFPTAAVAKLNFNEKSWADIKFNSGVFQWLLTPKSLRIN